MSKFDGILTKEDQETIQSVFVNLAQDTKDKINIVETMENVYYLHQSTFFDTLTNDEKLKVYIGIAITFDTLLDEQINPLTKKYILKGIDCFNNNIFYSVKGGVENGCFKEMP